VLILFRYWAVFFIDASSKERAIECFLNIARTCKISEAVEDVMKWLATKSHWLLLLDNIDNPAIDVSEFIPPGVNGTIIIATRNPDLRKHASTGSSKVGEMTPTDAALLLRKVAALDNVNDDEGIRQPLACIVEILDYLALAIIQAGAIIRQGICTIDSFCDLYTKHKKELLESGRPNESNDYQYSVFTTWDISIQQIEKMEDRHSRLALDLLRLFSFMYSGDIQETIFERAYKLAFEDLEVGLLRASVLFEVMPAGWDVVVWRKSISILITFSLITIQTGDRLSMHPLVHEWSRVRMSMDEQSRAWKTTAVILARSVSQETALIAQQQHRALIPHIDTLMAYDIVNLYLPGPDLRELSFVGKNFMVAYYEDFQAEKVSSPTRL
jgi:hypothetical protein